jgi:hypothetical protein
MSAGRIASSAEAWPTTGLGWQVREEVESNRGFAADGTDADASGPESGEGEVADAR